MMMMMMMNNGMQMVYMAGTWYIPYKATFWNRAKDANKGREAASSMVWERESGLMHSMRFTEDVGKKTVFASTAWTVHHHFHHFPQCLSIHHFQVQSPVLMCTSEPPPRKEPRRVATEPWCRDGRNGTRAGSLWKLVPEPERKCWARNETKAP